MKSFLFVVTVFGLMAGATLANAAELPAADYAVCDGLAEIAYQSAVLNGDALPDGAWSAALADCEEWSGEQLTLNEEIALDGEAWLPVCMFEVGGCK